MLTSFLANNNIGMCASQPGEGGFKCLPSYSIGENKLKELLLDSNSTMDADYVNKMDMLLSVGRIFQTQIFYPLLAASTGLLFLSVISMLLLKRYMKSMAPNAQPKMKRLRDAMSVSRQYAFGLAVAAAFSTTQAAGALNFATTALQDSVPGVTIDAGVPVQGLQWTIVGLLILFHLSVGSMFRADNNMGPPLDMGMPPPPPGFPGSPMGMPPPPPPPPGF